MKTLLISLALVATAASTPAVAQQEVDVHSVTVAFGDLDLGSAKGQAALERRVKGAIASVCNNPDERTLDSRLKARDCKRDARADLTDRLNHLAAAAKRAGSPSEQAFAAPDPSIVP